MEIIKKVVFINIVLVFFNCSSNDEYTDISTDEINEEEVVAGTDEEILSSILNLPLNSFEYNVALPNHFLGNGTQQEDNTPNNNPITNNGATLGRVLFYDKQLSANNTVSCASCHDQSKGFSDTKALSVGFNGGFTGRNSMGLSNSKYYNNGRFFWDERASTLEEQVLLPIQDNVEMGLTLDELKSKVEDDSYYSILFRRAFGDEIVTTQRISFALSQFIRSMVSYESKYDEGLMQTNNPQANFTNYTQSENLGKSLFFSNRTRCSDCHDTNVFVGDEARNNGLDMVFSDEGVQSGEFKVPSLRNIELTGPYMHDGRFTTLAQVVEHYNSGVQNSQDLDGRLRQGNGVRRLNLSNAEKQALVDFMLTLTDNSFITNEKFSNPFRNN